VDVVIRRRPTRPITDPAPSVVTGPPGARPAGPFAVAQRLAVQALRDLGHGLRRRRRRGRLSLDEYEKRWAGQLAGFRWEQADDLDQAVRTSSYGVGSRLCLVEGRPMYMAAEDFFAWRADVLGALFRELHEPDTPVTEVGCGTGKNLLVLARAGYRDLQGLEPTRSGREAVRQLSRRFELGVDVRPFDLLTSDPTPLRGRVVLTNHVMEQLPYDVERAVRNLASGRPAEVIHIEPCIESLSRTSLVDWATRWHAWAWDYQRNLLRVVARLENKGVVETLEVRRLRYAPHLRSDPTLVRWRSRW
jgi:hypothetical protein